MLNSDHGALLYLVKLVTKYIGSSLVDAVAAAA